jgi:hypothetical protein
MKGKKMVERSFTALPIMKNPLHYIHKYPQRTKGVLGMDYEQVILTVCGLVRLRLGMIVLPVLSES